MRIVVVFILMFIIGCSIFNKPQHRHDIPSDSFNIIDEDSIYFDDLLMRDTFVIINGDTFYIEKLKHWKL